jgi:hypothetical protein
MSIPVERLDELRGWKEIADYLGVTVRAAQKWEKERGLPVSRLTGQKGRIFASLRELESWKKSIINNRKGKSILARTETDPEDIIRAAIFGFQVTRPTRRDGFLQACAVLLLVLVAVFYFLK